MYKFIKSISLPNLQQNKQQSSQNDSTTTFGNYYLFP